MGETKVDISTGRRACPPAAGAWYLESELAGVAAPVTITASEYLSLVADSDNAGDFGDAATSILGDWYTDQADIEPAAATLAARRAAFRVRLLAQFSAIRLAV